MLSLDYINNYIKYTLIIYKLDFLNLLTTEYNIYKLKV